MTTTSHRIPPTQLRGAIEALLKRCPHSAQQLAQATGYSVNAIYHRLNELEDDELAHRVRVKHASSPGVCYEWRFGPSPAAARAQHVVLASKPPRAHLRVLVPFQSVVRSWPAILRCDPLVAALHGRQQGVAA